MTRPDGAKAWRGDGSRVDMLWRGTKVAAAVEAEELSRIHAATGYTYTAEPLPADRLPR